MNGCLYNVVTQVISRIETVFNVVIPWIVITSCSVASLVRLLYTVCASNQATAQPEVVVDSEGEYVRSTAIAQLCASLAFMVLSLPAHVHQLSVMLAGNESAPIALETYMTQRLLLVVLYSRCASTFFVHVAANRCFRRRLAALSLGRIQRHSDCCGSRGRSDAVDISLTQTWSHGADDNPPPTNGDARECSEMV